MASLNKSLILPVLAALATGSILTLLIINFKTQESTGATLHVSQPAPSSCTIEIESAKKWVSSVSDVVQSQRSKSCSVEVDAAKKWVQSAIAGMASSSSQSQCGYEAAIAKWPQSRRPIMFSPEFDPAIIVSVATREDQKLYVGFLEGDGFQHGVYLVMKDLVKDKIPQLMLDWGCNFGIVSTMLAKLGHRVVCVEAGPNTWKTLQFNLIHNCVNPPQPGVLVNGKVTSLNYGLSDVEGYGGTTEAVYSGAAHLLINGDKSGIPIKPFDKISEELQLNEKPYLLKIDIEGHELRALKGALNYLKKYPPQFIVFESNHLYLNPLELYTLVVGLGYDLYNIGAVDHSLKTQPLAWWLDWKSRPISNPAQFVKENPNWAGDIMAVRRG
eukprot:TRINITY_DN1_c0_g1_i2.p1 TRINITY_DN1_c0_g1~~TRINITY_DN1_c0_g1_i2.p1  ORF type:complete len:385 (+),score=77.93 TRINITY_DN1_c0_g1_i2:99-1253(+)